MEFSLILQISHSTNKFTKDFDFIAMNEKFKKDEVWGDLGGSTTQIRANEGIADDGNVDDTLEENEVMSENCEFKVYIVAKQFHFFSYNSSVCYTGN